MKLLVFLSSITRLLIFALLSSPVLDLRRLDSYGSTLDELFDNPKQVRSFIKDLGQITYKIDEDALMKLSDNPSDLIKGYRGYLEAQEEVFNLKNHNYLET